MADDGLDERRVGSDGTVNELTVGGQRLLLVELGGGEATHLAKLAEGDDTRRQAVPTRWLDGLTNLAPDVRRQLEDAQWSAKTQCGREWSFMAAGELGPLHEFQEVQLTPTCRRCLSILDKLFPAPPADGRVALIAALVVDALRMEGVARVVGVPGDQAALVRTAIRTSIKKQLGFRSNTYQHDDAIEVFCEDAYAPHSARRQRAVAQALDFSADKPSTVDPSSWTIRWTAWGSD